MVAEHILQFHFFTSHVCLPSLVQNIDDDDDDDDDDDNNNNNNNNNNKSNNNYNSKNRARSVVRIS
jgi:hypothetical protein